MSRQRTVSAAAHVLLFEYIDGELKRKVVRGPQKKWVPRYRRGQPQDLKMPEYTPEAMSRLIEKRNLKFKNAVNEFIQTCVEEIIDPVIAIAEKYRPHVPLSPKELPPAPIVVRNPDDKERPAITELLEELVADPEYEGQIVEGGHRTFDERAAVYGESVLSEALFILKTAQERLTGHYLQAL